MKVLKLLFICVLFLSICSVANAGKGNRPEDGGPSIVPGTGNPAEHLTLWNMINELKEKIAELEETCCKQPPPEICPTLADVETLIKNGGSLTEVGGIASAYAKCHSCYEGDPSAVISIFDMIRAIHGHEALVEDDCDAAIFDICLADRVGNTMYACELANTYSFFSNCDKDKLKAACPNCIGCFIF